MNSRNLPKVYLALFTVNQYTGMTVYIYSSVVPVFVTVHFYRSLYELFSR